MSLLKLFLVYVKIGAILLGGGYVILPIMTSEFVDKRKLLTTEEMTDYFALAQSLPGIIAANMSMFIGYKLRGKSGAVIAMLGIIFVPFWAIVLLGTILGSLVSNNYVQAVLWGVGIAVIALIMLTIRELWQNSQRNRFFYFIFLTSLLTLLFFKLSPVAVIFIYTAVGILFKYIQKRRTDK